MPPHFGLARDAPHTRERRTAILGAARLFEDVPGADLAPLVAASALAACSAGTLLFTRGDLPRQVYFIGSGCVQIRVGRASEADDVPPLHLRLLTPGDIAGDRELACLAAGSAGQAPRRNAAVVLGGPAEIVAVDQLALARLLAGAPQARLRLAADIQTTIDAILRLTDDILAFRNMGKVRLARFLLELFDVMGRVRGSGLEVPHGFSHADLAASLGLTRRSIVDDIQALEDFDAIDHARDGRLLLRDRNRLCRIAALAPSADKDESAAAWLADVERALAAGDTLQAFELAREALLYHPRDPALRYAAVLAALRAGLLAAAEEMRTSFGFSADDASEPVAALAARALKERAFAAADGGQRRAFAARSAAAYASIHARTGGTYPAINAAAMFRLAGDTAACERIAKPLADRAPSPLADYWAKATHAEALFLLDRRGEAALALLAASGSADAEDGKQATTRRQFRRLGVALGVPAAGLVEAMPIRPILVLDGAGEQAPGAGAMAQTAARVFAPVATAADLAACLRLAGLGAALSLVLSAPAEALLDRAAGGPQERAAMRNLLGTTLCHMAMSDDAVPDPRVARRQGLRRALGLAVLAAQDREAPLLLATGGSEAAPLAVWPDPGVGDPSWPGWAGGSLWQSGDMMLIWVEASPAGVAPCITADAEASSAEGRLFYFHETQRCLDAAFSLLAAAVPGRLCIDLAPRPDGRADTAPIAKRRPAVPSGQVFATEAAAAEIVLSRLPRISLHASGRVRCPAEPDRPVARFARRLKAEAYLP